MITEYSIGVCIGKNLRGGGVRAIATHHGPTTGGRTCDRRGCLKKDKYVSDLMLRQTPDRALKKRTGRMATLSVHCAKFTVSMQVATDWCSRGISLFLWRGGRNINNQYSAFEYRYSIVKKNIAIFKYRYFLTPLLKGWRILHGGVH